MENWESIKDILIHNGQVYISYIEEQSSDCTNVQIITGKLDFKKIVFEKTLVVGVHGPKEVYCFLVDKLMD